MKLKIDIASENDAFTSDHCNAETVRILHDIADRIERGNSAPGKIFDINGNAVGVFEYMPTEPADVDPFADSFMKPQIEHGNYFEVETSHGTEIVPASLFGLMEGVIFRNGTGDLIGAKHPGSRWSSQDVDVTDRHADDAWLTMRDALAPYCESGTEGIIEITARCAWLARMSAPGYLDCTDWTAWDSAEDARRYLIHTYGDES